MSPLLTFNWAKEWQYDIVTVLTTRRGKILNTECLGWKTSSERERGPCHGWWGREAKELKEGFLCAPKFRMMSRKAWREV